MYQNKIVNLLGFTGAFFVLLGVFCPVVDMPFEGPISFVNRWLGAGIVIIFLSFLAGLLSFLGKSKYLWFPAFIIGAIMLYHFYDLNKKLDQYSFGNSFLKTNINSIISLEWGWFVLLGSTSLLIVSSILSYKNV